MNWNVFNLLLSPYAVKPRQSHDCTCWLTQTPSKTVHFWISWLGFVLGNSASGCYEQLVQDDFLFGLNLHYRYHTQYQHAAVPGPEYCSRSTVKVRIEHCSTWYWLLVADFMVDWGLSSEQTEHTCFSVHLPYRFYSWLMTHDREWWLPICNVNSTRFYLKPNSLLEKYVLTLISPKLQL